MAFKAEDVEALGYDFSMFNAGQGPIVEPTPEQVGDFWIAEAKIAMLSATFVGEEIPDEEGDAARDERRERDLAKVREHGLHIFDERRKALSAVCSGNPSIEQLEKLPSRILTAFEKYLTEAFTPEA